LPEDPNDSPGDTAGGYGDYNPSRPINASLEETLRQGLANVRATIDLSAISPTKDEVKAAMTAIIYSSPEYFYLESAYRMSSNNRGVQSLTPTYSATPSEIAAMRETYRQKLAEIVENAPRGGADFDKILYLHDYFTENYTYDEGLSVRDAYSLFTGKTGVCQAYMLGLIAAARELGIESLPVTSDVMKHAWNLVKIDGEWYHVDLTWDDSGTLPTLTSYTYFLQSDAGLVAIDATKKESDRHRDWVAAESATSTKYDAAAYRQSHAPMVKHEGVYYCTVSVSNHTTTVHGVIFSGVDPTAMTHFLDVKGGYWEAGTNRYYPDCYAGLAVENGLLYYNSGNSIVRVDLAASTAGASTFAVTGLGAGESIYGLVGVKNGTVTYLKSTAPNGAPYTLATLIIP